MIKAGDFRTKRLLMNDAVVVQKRWEVWIIPASCNESHMPTRLVPRLLLLMSTYLMASFSQQRSF